MKLPAKFFATLATAGLLYPAHHAVAAAGQRPIVYSSQAMDQGNAPADTVIDLVIAMNPLNRDALERFVASTIDPTSRNYRQFITPQQFAASYGQPAAVVDRVRTYLESQGMTVTKVFDNNLVMLAQATNAQAAALFATPIHTFVENGVASQRPLFTPVVPAALQDVVIQVAGLSTQPKARKHFKLPPNDDISAPAFTSLAQLQPLATLPTSRPGQYSTKDFSTLYNVAPLYARGVTGAGRTLGIMTFANFLPSDAAAFWAAVGLTGTAASTSRITEINVIPGSAIGTDGDDETTLDVEYSGGIAPGAAVRVYEAPNTDAGFLALFATAISDNLCDSLSISWGSPEWYNSSNDLMPYDAVLLQAAAQGIPISASSGDAGAYDLGYIQAYPYYSNVLSVDFPSSSPYVLASGGTTLPVTITKTNPTFSYTVTAEQPWAWDYLLSYYAAKTGSSGTQSTYYKSYFPVGGGGGVSVLYPIPAYQTSLAGLATSAAGQAEICFTSQPVIGSNPANPCTPGPTSTFSDGSFFPGGALLPAGFGGRNTPDVSLNADTYSGYVLLYRGSFYTQGGGTSFVAPQLNGVFTLLTQQAGRRIGWPHPQLYNAFRAQGYATGSPFRAIKQGSNLFYKASQSYNPATGLGSLDVDNLSRALIPASASSVKSR